MPKEQIFDSYGTQNFACENNAVSCWPKLETTIFDLQMEEEATIVWPSPFGIIIRQLGLSFAMGKLQHEMKHTILDSLSNSLSKQ